MNDAAIEVIGVSKAFGKERVLKDVTITFEKGKIHGVIGRNGSGKTVLMKCILGFLAPTSGYVRVLGRRIGKDADFAPRTGMIIEAPGFLPGESARSNLRWLARLTGGARAARVDEVIALCGLDPKLKKPVGKYSMGMRQRLGLAQALLDDPELMVLDEPMNGLDKQGVIDMRALIKRLKAEGKTILLSSHFAQDIDELCDTVCEMDRGQITRCQ